MLVIVILVFLSFVYFFWVMQAVVLCQVEKAKEDMLNKLYSSVRLVIISVIYVYFMGRSGGMGLKQVILLALGVMGSLIF